MASPQTKQIPPPNYQAEANPEKVQAALAALDPALFPDWNCHALFSDFQLRLYRTLYPDTHPDASFVVGLKNAPVLVVRGTINDGLFSCLGLPAVFSFYRDLSAIDALRAGRAALKHIAKMGPDGKGGRAIWRGNYMSAGQGPADDLAAAMEARAEPVCHVTAPLDQEEDALLMAMRDSARQAVRWGTTNLHMVYANQNNPDPQLFSLYRDFFLKVAGAKRSDEHFDAYFNEIAAGGGEMSFGYLEDGTLAAATIVIDTGKTSYYSAGVYDRSLFPKPISHFPVFDSMRRAKARGQSLFDIGGLTTREAGASDKEVDISHFKRGFSNDSSIYLKWHWSA